MGQMGTRCVRFQTHECCFSLAYPTPSPSTTPTILRPGKCEYIRSQLFLRGKHRFVTPLSHSVFFARVVNHSGILQVNSSVELEKREIKVTFLEQNLTACLCMDFQSPSFSQGNMSQKAAFVFRG